MFKNKQYIYVEADFGVLPDPPPYFSMMLVQGDTSLPLISYFDRGLHEKADRDDYDAYMNGKTFHRIVLNADNIKKGGKRYFAVYKLLWDIGNYPSPSNHIVSYSITARVSANFECLNNCNGKGACDAVLEQCDCYAGFFDSDCSLEARRLNPGVPQSQPVYPNDAAYYYASFQDADEVMVFSFKVNKPGWNVAVQFNKPKDYLINSRYALQYSNQYPMIALETSQKFSTVTVPDLAYYVGGYALVFISNPTANTMYATVQIDFEAKEKSKMMLTIAIVGGVVFALIVCGACIAAKCRARRERYINNVQIEIQIVERAPGQRGQGQRPSRRNRNNPEQSPFLSEAEIVKYFPIMEFSEMKTSFAQTSCSICLDEFIGEAKCHQLYCEHIFHDKCIESWLAKQSNCPNCKSEMTREIIEKFMDDKKKEENGETPKMNALKIPEKSENVSVSVNSGNLMSQDRDHDREQEPENHQPEQANRGGLENSVYENSDSEGNPIDLNSPFQSPMISPTPSRILGDHEDPEDPDD